jgi:hypothetical protein
VVVAPARERANLFALVLARLAAKPANALLNREA